MNIQSKYNAGDKVWVYRNEDSKFYEGTIQDIQSWDKWNSFRYEVIHHGEMDLIINVEEKLVFDSREEIVNNRFISESE